MNQQTSIHFPVHINSLDAYYNQVVPTLPDREKKVLDAIKLFGQCTGKDLEGYFNKAYHKFSGRITELKKKKLIKEVGRKKIGDSSFSIYEINK